MAADNNRLLNSKNKQTEVDLSSPTGAKREPYKYVESLDKAAIRHAQCYTIRKQLPALNTLNSNLVWYLSFPGSVETR